MSLERVFKSRKPLHLDTVNLDHCSVTVNPNSETLLILRLQEFW